LAVDEAESIPGTKEDAEGHWDGPVY
jgi:hypothetical protein